MKTDEAIVNAYLLFRLKDNVAFMFSPDNTFRQSLEASIHAMLEDVYRYLPDSDELTKPESE